MSLQFNCPKCQKKLKAPERLAGKQVRCTGCQQVVVVPRPELPEEEEEPLFARHGHGEHEELIDMTAMVDVVFFLLIFFMVTSMHTLQAALQMPPPNPAEGASGQSIASLDDSGDTVTVQVDENNTIWINERIAPSRQELIAELREARDTDGVDTLVVMASGDAWHETVVMALDAGTSAGMENVKLASLGQDDL